ncbi:hypothetical protein MMC17_005379 [Xylographa soralifera]|nr:hypothetical protein [Xylographa soralifera]
MGIPKNEFPVLRALGLCAGDTTGYGDCLFRALSDQLYGDESHHHEIRARVVEHMRENANIYRNFTAVDAGGAIRRNARRSTASYRIISSEMPSEEEIDQRFYDNLNVMAKAGTYGDHLEIQAFCETYGVDVKVYQKENGEITLEGFRTMAEKKPLVLLAYHNYEHYSSIHSLTIPHTGIIHPNSDTADEYTSASDSQQSSAGGACLQRLQRLRLSQPKPRPLSLTMKDRRKLKGRSRKLMSRSRMQLERMAAGLEPIHAAGVSGLTTALLLSQNPAYRITVVAKYMPGDYDIEYASPWAGANYLPVSAAGTSAADHDRNTWPELAKLARDSPESGVHFQDTIIYSHADDTANELCKPDPWFAAILPNFHLLPPSQRRGYDHATAFTSVCINTSIYLPYLVSRCAAAGVQFRRAVFAHIADAARAAGRPADLVVNCTGLASLKLGGVADKAMMPVRGQTVLVRNEAGVMAATSRTGDGVEEMCYVMQRAVGGGTLIGGCAQPGNWDAQFDPNLANRIMQRAVALCPALTGGRDGGNGSSGGGIEHLSIIRHQVGLRPLRTSGVRLEKERIEGVWTVHNYGHGGYGYQSSYGCAQVVVGLVGEVLGGREGREGRARL